MSGIPEDAVSEPQTPIPTLLPVHQNKLPQQLLFCFHVSGIPEDAVHKAQTLMQILLPVHADKLLQQLLFGFHVSGIPEDAVHKAQTLMPVYCLCISTNLSISCSSVSTWAGSQMMQSMGQTLMQVGFS